MKNSIALLAVFLLVPFLITPIIASPDPARVLYVKPTSGAGTGPYVISSPAFLEVGINAEGHGTVTDIWLILILNDNTKTNLVKITTTVTSDFLPGDFIDPDSVPETRIPRTASGQYDSTYPGYQFDEQYTVSALKTHMYGSDTSTIWYFVRKTDISGITKDSPATFTVTVNAPLATQMKVMVLAIGYSATLDNQGTGLLNECTSLSNYTFVVPEIATILLALAPVAGLALYTYKQKKRAVVK